MKKALKLAALTAMLALVLSSFYACNTTDKDSNSTTAVPVSETEKSEENKKTDKAEKEEPTEAEKTTEAEVATDKIEVDSIDTILHLIKDYPIGTAGSTAKSVDLAIRLINFTENCDNTDSVEADIKDFLNELSDEEKEMFAQCFDEIDYMARKLISGSTSSIKQYIEESSEKFDEGNYSTEKYEVFFNILKNS